MNAAMKHFNLSYSIKRLFFYLLLCILGFVCILPLYWMIRSSFMKNSDIYQLTPFVIWPEPMLWDNFTKALGSVPFTKYSFNTIIIMLCNLAGVLLTSSLAAYAFARLEWLGKRICFALILATMMLPNTVVIIPQFILWKNLGFIDTYVPLIAPAFLGGGAFNIFLMRQFLLGIPKEMDEAAKIDGAGNLRVFFQIIMPLAKSALVVIGLFTFLNSWNDFFGPVIYINTQSKFTLALGLLQFRGEYMTKWNLVMAASAVIILPCIIIYLIGQKYLIEGITLTGMKA